MMFGGRERMVQAKSDWLTNAKNILGADSAMFDIGAYEGEAR
jgi:hypothetical protein